MHENHDQMNVELQVAMNFIISYLYNKLPRTRVHLYGEELEKLLRVKFSGHWYPSNPVKGSAFRCVHLNSSEIDPSFELAAARSGLDFVNDIKSNLPSVLSVWVDPGEVSYAIGGPDGKPGPVRVLFKQPFAQNESKESGNEQQNEVFQQGMQVSPDDISNHNSYMAFNPHAKDFLPKSPDVLFNQEPQQVPKQSGQAPSFCYSLRPQRKLYTVDEFASTKFGSTKVKSNARNLTAFQRMQPAAYQNPAATPGEVFLPTPLPYMGEQQSLHMEPQTFFQNQQEHRPSSLATASSSSAASSSSFSSESSSGSSASSSPDHISGHTQFPKVTNNAATSPTSPWGESFSLPSSIYKPVEYWPIERGPENFPSMQEDYSSFTGISDFIPTSSQRIPAATSSAPILPMAK